MLIAFHEEFRLPVDDVYPYFRSPEDWTRLYGSFGPVQNRGEGWFAVPLRAFPFPLVARITTDEPLRRVAWELGGFWKGTGEISFTPTTSGVVAEGYEDISVRPLFWLSPLIERLVLERRFRAVWESGWRRLRRQAEKPGGEAQGSGLAT